MAVLQSYSQISLDNFHFAEWREESEFYYLDDSFAPFAEGYFWETETYDGFTIARATYGFFDSTDASMTSEGGVVVSRHNWWWDESSETWAWDFRLTGFSIPLEDFVAVTKTVEISDDQSLLAQILNGADKITLSDYDDYMSGFSGNDTVNGGNGNDTIEGGNNNDKLYGGDGNDILNGDAGNDRLQGDAGNDTLNGGTGVDTLIGGTGNDTYVVDNVSDKITELANAGTDTVQSSVTYTLAAHVENLTVTGSGAINGTGNTLNNVITGNSGNNILDGGTGADSLIGGTGSDLLYGGADSVRDVFIFNSIADSKTGSTRDKVYDFRTTVDDLDLRGIDANTKLTGNQEFSFNTTTAKANSVWYKTANLDGNTKTKEIIVYGDVNGDAKADFEIGLMGVTSVIATDFLM
jgi:Ca2+-binding RTX toxin-like protein